MQRVCKVRCQALDEFFELFVTVCSDLGFKTSERSGDDVS